MERKEKKKQKEINEKERKITEINSGNCCQLYTVTAASESQISS